MIVRRSKDSNPDLIFVAIRRWRTETWGVNFTGAYQVTILTNLGRVALLAAEAKRGPTFALSAAQHGMQPTAHLVVRAAADAATFGRPRLGRSGSSV